MAEYIEREALKRSIFNGVWYDNQDEDVAYDLVDKAPTADVVEVRHGHWYFACVHQDKKFYKCSNCHHAFPFNSVNYCPACGAKMDGKGDME